MPQLPGWTSAPRLGSSFTNFAVQEFAQRYVHAPRTYGITPDVLQQSLPYGAVMRFARRVNGWIRPWLRIIAVALVVVAALGIPFANAGRVEATTYIEPPTPAPAWTATVQEYPVPVPAGTFQTSLSGITRGSDGNLWATQYLNGTSLSVAIDRVTPTGTVTQFNDPSVPLGQPGEIGSGPDGALWYGTNQFSPYTSPPQLNRVTTAGSFSSFPMPGFFGFNGITTGPDQNLWFPDSSPGPMGSFNVSTHQVTSYSTSMQQGNKWELTVGSDRNLWYSEGSNAGIGRMTTAGVNTHFLIPATDRSQVVETNTYGITSGPDGALWFTEPIADEIGRLTTTGVFSFFAVPTTSSNPLGITTGPDGDLWFTEQAIGRIGRLNPATGQITDFRLPNLFSQPTNITSAGGKLWFTENYSNRCPSGTGGQCPMVASLDPSTATPPPAPCLTATQDVTLTQDLGPCAGDGIDIAANNVTVNLNGHTVYAASGTRYGDFAGVRFESVNHSTVEGFARAKGGGGATAQGKVTGFDAGVLIDHGSSNTVTELNIHDNVGSTYAIASLLGDGVAVMHSPANTISDNTVNHNGIFDDISLLGLGTNSNIVQGNSMTNSLGEFGGDGDGIVANPFLELENPQRGLSLLSNSILDNTVSGNTGQGISDASDVYATVEGNTVTNNAFNGIGVSSLQNAVADTHDVVQNNTSTGNGQYGIVVASRQNRIVDNVTNGNATNDLADLYQFHHNGSTCYNVWSGNTWGSGGYLSGCETIGGSGPNPPAAVPNTAAPIDPTAHQSRGKPIPSS